MNSVAGMADLREALKHPLKFGLESVFYLGNRRSFLMLARKPPVRSNEMAGVTVRMSLQIVLMFRLGFPKSTGRREFSHHFTGPNPRRVDISDGVTCNSFLFVACVEDGGTIAGSPVVALAIQCGRVMNLEEELKQRPVTELVRNEDDFNCLGMSAVMTVGRIGYVATRIADPCRNHTKIAAQQVLHAPKATACKNCAFGRCAHFITPCLRSRIALGSLIRRSRPISSTGGPCASVGVCRSRMNADDRLSLDPFGRVEGGDGIV